jgi:hypothetical protein
MPRSIVLAVLLCSVAASALAQIGPPPGGGGSGISGLTNNVVPKSNSAGTNIVNGAATDTGNTFQVAEGALETPVALTDGSTVAVNCYLSNNFTLQLTASGHTISNPTNCTAGQRLDFLVQQPASGGPYTVSWGAAYVWVASAPVLNTGASAYTEAVCKITATTPTMICYAHVNGATGAASVAAPAAPASTSAYQAQGLSSGTTIITPVTTGNVAVTISGTCETTVTTVTDGAQFYIMHGTGNGNANGSTTLGTQDGSVEPCQPGTTLTAAADWKSPWSKTWVVTGLTVGTAYYFDLAGEAIGASAVKLVNVDVAAYEIQ